MQSCLQSKYTELTTVCQVVFKQWIFSLKSIMIVKGMVFVVMHFLRINEVFDL